MVHVIPEKKSSNYKPLLLLPLLMLLIGCKKPTDISTYLTELHQEGKLNGTVLVMKNDSLFYEGSFGNADASGTEKLTQDHRFNIGSIYKEFPAVAIMQLQEQGKLQLDDKLSRYVSGLPEWSHRVSIKNLLQYTSGLPKMKFDEHFDKGIIVTDQVIWNDLQNVEELEFEPGRGYTYTNYSPMLLIKIIESISKQGFPAYVSENLFEPYGLHKAKINFQYPYLDRSFMAIPFDENLEEDKYNIKINWILFSATTTDLYAWFKHLDSFKIISKESVKFLSEEANSGRNIQAPIGYCDWDKGDIQEHIHHGSSASYEGLVQHYKKDGLMIILLTNQKQGNLFDIADTIYDLVI